jgi:hypothetical protein
VGARERREGGGGGLYIFVQIEIHISRWKMRDLHDADAVVKLALCLKHGPTYTWVQLSLT